jgi:FAD:protein FMN transferase
MEFQEFRAMNTSIVLAAEGRHDRLERGFQEARAVIEEGERRFTRFSPDSELTQLNRSAGSWFHASPDLFNLMSSAQSYYLETGGLFDPSILPALKAAGYTRSMDVIRGQEVKDDQTPGQNEKVNFGMVLFDEEQMTIRLPAGMEIDLGGIAKGWIAEQAAYRLFLFSTACAVNAGGDMRLVGLPSDGEKWNIDLENPLDPQNNLATLSVGEGAVATSSTVRRSWTKAGKVQHHIIDPRQLAPAETDWLSVTAVSSSAMTAEVYAKTLLIAGPNQAPGFQAARRDLDYLAVDRQGRLWGSANMKEYLDAEN